MVIAVVRVKVRVVGELAGAGGVPGVAPHPRHAPYVLRRHPPVVPPPDTQNKLPVSPPGGREGKQEKII